jgi:hypothetical protein
MRNRIAKILPCGRRERDRGRVDPNADGSRRSLVHRHTGHRERADLVLRAGLVVVTGLVVARPAGAEASTEAGGPPPGRYVFTALPVSDLYPGYVADPLRAQSAVILAAVPDSEIPDSGGSRFILRLGGNFPLFRVHPVDEPDKGIQLDFKGGFFGHFDIENSLDNIGWDGIFGLALTWKPTSALAVRVGTLHDSAHVGDEYAEKTGRTRIDYTREECIAGVSWSASPRWSTYAVAGWGFGLEDFQEPLRLQLGIETYGERRFWNEKANWYVAADVGSYEEWDWDARLTMQTGIAIRTGQAGQRYRLAIEYVNGRSVLGEFSMHDESTLGLGWFFDF